LRHATITGTGSFVPARVVANAELSAALGEDIDVFVRSTLGIRERHWCAPGESTADLAERSAWLRHALRGSWKELEPAVAEWRSALIATVLAIPADAVVFTHFVAINTVVAAASRDDRLTVFTPTNCSRTVVDIESGNLSVVQLGGQADTDVA